MIISVINKILINDNSNSIIFGIQHNLRHFQGDVSFTENYICYYFYNIKILKLIKINLLGFGRNALYKRVEIDPKSFSIESYNEPII